MNHQEHERFYNSKRWRKHAAAVLSKHNYIDQVEKRYGRLVPAEVVHHALPLEDYPEYAFETWNNIPVSRSTHRSLHNDNGTLTRRGVDLAKRTARRAGVDFREPEASGNHRSAGRTYAGKCRDTNASPC